MSSFNCKGTTKPGAISGRRFATGNNPNNNYYTNVQPHLISIEGNIGAGKTTLFQRIKNKNIPNIHFINEPVDMWSSIKNENNEDILSMFYKDKKRWSYTFQTMALLTRYQNIERTINNILKDEELKLRYSSSSSVTGSSSSSTSDDVKSKNIIFITERCLQTDCNVFTKMLYDEGNINKVEMELYENLLKHLTNSDGEPSSSSSSPSSSLSTNLSGIIHVHTEPDICFERIKNRSRTGEDVIPIEYLELLDKYQNEWLYYEQYHNDVPYVKIDCNSSNNHHRQTAVATKTLTTTEMVAPHYEDEDCGTKENDDNVTIIENFINSLIEEEELEEKEKDQEAYL